MFSVCGAGVEAEAQSQRGRAERAQAEIIHLEQELASARAMVASMTEENHRLEARHKRIQKEHMECSSTIEK